MLISLETHSKACFANLVKQRDEGFLCDIELVVEGERFLAHRNVLAANSDYFSTMFRTNMKEKFSHSVELKEMSSETMGLIVNFMYFGEIDLTSENVMGILQAASMMQMKELMKTVEHHYFMEILKPENALEIRNISKIYFLELLREKADECIFDNFEDVCLSKQFLELCEEDIEYFLRSDKVRVESEDVLFSLLMLWTNHNLKLRKKLFLRLFGHIRLQLISSWFLTNHVRKEELVLGNPKCRNLVEDAMHFHFEPDFFEKEMPRAVTNSPKWYLLTPKHEITSLLKTASACEFEVNQPQMHVDYNCAIALHQNKVFFCGGDISARNQKPTGAIVSFDGDVWKEEGTMQNPRTEAVAVSNGDALFIFGGRTNNNFINCTEKFVDGCCKTDQLRPQHHNRCSSCAVLLKDCVYLIGGCGQIHANGFQLTRIMHSSVERFKLATNERLKGPSLNHKRGNCAAQVVENIIYVFELVLQGSGLMCPGGVSDGKQPLNSAEFLDTSNSQVWTLLTPAPVPMPYASCCLLSNHDIVLLGRDSDQLFCFNTTTTSWENRIKTKKRKLQGDGANIFHYEELFVAPAGSKIFGPM